MSLIKKKIMIEKTIHTSQSKIKVEQKSSRLINKIPNKIKKSRLVGSYHLHFKSLKTNYHIDLDFLENRLI